MDEALTCHQLLTRIDGARSLEEVTTLARVHARRLLNAKGVTVIVREDDKCFYVDEDSIAPLWKGQRFPITDCVSGWAMLNRETAVIPDISEDPRVPQQAYRATFVKAMLMVPIDSADPVGAMGAYWAEIHYASHDEIHTLEAIAAAVADAMVRIGMDEAPWAPTLRMTAGAVGR